MNENYIFVTFKTGKKEYHVTVSSWDYNGKNLWLYVYGDENGNGGNCGYIPNARVIATSRSVEHDPHISLDVLKIIRGWSQKSLP